MKTQGEQASALDVPSAAMLLGVSPATIRKWVLIRHLPFYKLGARVIFDRDELLRWRESFRIEATA